MKSGFTKRILTLALAAAIFLAGTAARAPKRLAAGRATTAAAARQ